MCQTATWWRCASYCLIAASFTQLQSIRTPFTAEPLISTHLSIKLHHAPVDALQVFVHIRHTINGLLLGT